MKYLAPFGEFLGIPILVSLLWIILLFALFFKLELVLVEFFTECHLRLLYLKMCRRLGGGTEINDVKHQAFAAAVLLGQKSRELMRRTQFGLAESS